MEGSKTVSGIDLLRVKIKRNTQTELEIFVQSHPSYWKFMRRDDQTTFKLAGIVCYKPKMDRFQGVNGFCYLDSIHEVQDYPNLALLLAKDIEQGVKFNFGPFPISRERLKDWISKFETQVKMLYFQYSKPQEYSLDITTELVQKERMD